MKRGSESRKEAVRPMLPTSKVFSMESVCLKGIGAFLSCMVEHFFSTSRRSIPIPIIFLNRTLPILGGWQLSINLWLMCCCR